VLGPLLFLLFVNDLDLAVSLAELLFKFADETKLAGLIQNGEDREQLQASLDGLVKWSDTWGMTFNVKKCKVMHLGRNNPRATYKMCGTELEVTREEKDIGVIITDNLKPAAQCAKAARTAKTVLGKSHVLLSTETSRYSCSSINSMCGHTWNSWSRRGRHGTRLIKRCWKKSSTELLAWWQACAAEITRTGYRSLGSRC
jgi:hypothetical protein